MRYIRGLYFTLALFSIVGVSHAGGWVGQNKIQKIAFQSEHVFLYSDGWNNANGCQKTTAVVLAKNDPNFDKAYSLVLAAFMAGKDISGYSDGCITWDDHTYNTIRGHKYLTVY